MTWLAFVLAALAWPTTSAAAGCDVLRDPRERADCVARQEARAAARAEVQRQLDGGGGGGDAPSRTSRDAAPASRSAAWQDALEDSKGIDAGELLDARLLAAVGGLAWFGLVVRARRRRARRRV